MFFLPCLLVLLAVFLCACSAPSLSEAREAREAEEALRQEYARTELSLVAESPEDLTILDNYTQLKSLDLHGSRCYAAIERYIAAHPEVEVLYSVRLGPDETMAELENTAGSAVLEDGKSVGILAQNAGSFHLLKEIVIASPDFSSEDLSVLRAALPGAGVRFRITGYLPEITPDEESLDLTGLRPEDAERAAGFLEKMPVVQSVFLTPESGENLLSFREVRLLQDARPEALYDYRFESFGQTVSTADEELEYLWAYIYNEGMEKIRAMMPCMTRLKSLFFQYCEIDYEVLAQFRDEYPDVNIAWRVDFGPYSCRTDTERIFANGSLTGNMCYNLRYCNKVKYIDMGHNDNLNSIDFVAFMPDLEIAIFAATSIWDISPLANCSKLWYLEIFVSNVYDVSPLANCTNLEHLNISCLFGLRDISPLYGLTNLKRLWNTCTVVPWAQRQEIMERLPDCEFCFDYVESTGNHWRYEADGSKNEIYAQVDAIFDYENFRDNLSWW
jgi:hypothetical protein